MSITKLRGMCTDEISLYNGHTVSLWFNYDVCRCELEYVISVE